MANTDGVEWHVLPGNAGQRLTQDIGDNGFTDVWEVTYQVDSGPATGAKGTVRIPAGIYNAAKVQEVIAAQVRHMHETAAL